MVSIQILRLLEKFVAKVKKDLTRVRIFAIYIHVSYRIFS